MHNRCCNHSNASLAAMAEPAQRCFYGMHCVVAAMGEPGGPELKECGVAGCTALLHHVCQGEYEAKFPEKYSDVPMAHLCIFCLARSAKGCGLLFHRCRKGAAHR